MADVSRGDWQCPNPECYNHTNFPMGYVYGSSVNCKKCGTGKAAQRAGDWCCPNPQCVNQNYSIYGTKATCPRCGTAKPASALAGKAGMGAMGAMGMVAMPGAVPGMPAAMNPGGVSPPREGDWHCGNPSCKNHKDNVVYSSKTACPLCGMAKPAQPVMATPRVQGASMAQQQQQQQLLALAAYGGTQFAGAPFSGGQVCTVATPMPTGKFAKPGDWNCANPQCKNHVNNVVYGSKERCPLCNMPKPVTGARIVGMRPGDWHCPSPYCKNHTGNIIYANKPTCPLCNTPKPTGLDTRDRSRSPGAVMY